MDNILKLNANIPVDRLCEVAQALVIYQSNQGKVMRKAHIDLANHTLVTSRPLTDKEKSAVNGIESGILNTL